MDISTSKAVASREDEGVEVHIADESGEKQYYGEKGDQPVTITVVGTYSARYRRAVEASRDKSIKRRSAIDARTLDDQALETIAGCILDWRGFTNGTDVYPYTRANAVALLEACPWIREQVENAMSDHAAFFRAS
jgi:Mg-chelatase subunit ChlI